VGLSVLGLAVGIGACGSDPAPGPVAAITMTSSGSSGVPQDAGLEDGASSGGLPRPDAAPDANSKPKGQLLAFVGSNKTGINVFRVVRPSGPIVASSPLPQLNALSTLPTQGNPSWIAADPERGLVFATDEGTEGAVRSYRIAKDSGKLTPISRQGVGGVGTAHLAVHPSGRWITAANYTSGSVSILPVAADGTLGTALPTLPAGPKAHQVVFDSSGSILWVPCLGSNNVMRYTFDAQTGAATGGVANSVGSNFGPRHMAFSPSGQYAFVLGESSSKVAPATVVATGLSFAPQVSTLPANFSGNNTGSEIVMHPAGHSLYASNRGHHSIVRYSVSGPELRSASHTNTEGATPRSFAIDSSGSMILVGNEGSGSLAVGNLDAAGNIVQLKKVLDLERPTFVGLFEFAAQ
jgi:6-phosphogluconolactonase